MTRIVSLVTVLITGAAMLAGCGTAPGAGPIDREPGTTAEAAPGHPVQLSSQQNSASFELENISDDALDWTIEVSNDDDNPQPSGWFTISPSQGRLGPFEREVVTLTQLGGLEPGRYSSVLRVVYQGGVTAFDVIGEVLPDGSQGGDGRIEGRLRTDNALIPLVAPDRFGTRSALETSSMQPREERPEFVPGQLIVGLDPAPGQLSASSREPLEALAARHGSDVLSEDLGSGTALLGTGEDPARLAARLEAEPSISFAEPNYLFYPHALPNDPYLDDAWQLTVVGAPVAWQAPLSSGNGPVVAIIDSGIDLDHEDLSGIFVSTGYDFCSNSDCLNTDSNPRPDDFSDTHGTHVTGLLAAIAGNGRGSAGVAGQVARILPVKVFNYDPSYGTFTTAQALADAIRWSAGLNVQGAPNNPNPADIITLSLGSGADSQLVRDAVEAARDSGALIIASAGNQGHSSVDYPARYDTVVAVGSVNTDFERSCFSDYGAGLDIMAPGGDGYLCAAENDEAILSTFPGDDYGIDAGTSMAAPIAAGAAALVWAQMSGANPDAVRAKLLDTAYFDSSYMSEDRYGAGVLRADLALGFPGPGDRAAVQATGPGSALDTVTLQLDGASTSFLLNGLASGNYTVAADAAGERYALTGSAGFQLVESEDLSGVAVPLGR